MKRKERQGDQEDEETERLIKVVEYLQPVMSKELLFKFPDNSAFDFDYSQSSIWSPLVPRIHNSIDLDYDLRGDLVTPRKLKFGFGFDFDDNKISSGSKKKVITSKVVKRVISSKNVFKVKSHRRNKVLTASFSTTPVKCSCAPFATKAWNKILKAASKHMKKKKKEDRTVHHVKLSNYLTDA